MALQECKECGYDVARSAKTCLNCGAPNGPKQYSLFKTLFIGIVVLAIIGGFPSNDEPSSSYSSPSTQPAVNSKLKPAAKPSPPNPSWGSVTSKDKMTGVVSGFATSKKVSAEPRMSFPYSGVEAWMGVGCKGNTKWAYFGFSTSPNLDDTETEDGYNTIRERIKWDDQVQYTSLFQEWGATSIHFDNGSAAIAKIMASNSVLL
jgi:hypothetical protein